MSALLKLTAALCAIIAAPAVAQSTQPDPPQGIAPLRSDPDPNGVNLLDGRKDVEMPVVLSAPGDPRLSFDKIQNWRISINGTSGSASQGEGSEWSYTVNTGHSTSESFTCDQEGGCTNVTASGSELRNIGSYRRAPGGEVYAFDVYVSYTPFQQSASKLTRYASSISYPDGEVISISYEQGYLSGWQACSGAGSRNCASEFRPSVITSSTGYSIDIEYQAQGTDPNQAGWGTPASAELHGPGGALIQRVTYSGTTIKDFGNDTSSPGKVYSSTVGNSLSFAGAPLSGGGVEQPEASIMLPGETSPHLTISRASSDSSSILYFLIGSINRDGVNWTYSYTNPHHPTDQSLDVVYDSVTVSGPNGYHVVYDMFKKGESGAPVPLHNLLKQRTDALNHTTKYAYGTRDRLTGVTMPELNSVNIGYDSCGNVISKTTHAKSGTSVLTEFAHYPDLSTPIATCPETRSYRPDSSTDANNNVTTYVFNSAGQIQDQDDPADTANVVRRTHSDYQGDGITSLSRRTSVQVCDKAHLPCSSSYVTRTDYGYWNNTFLPAMVIQYDRDTGGTRATTYRYDAAGRVAMIDGPLPAPAHDEKYFQYDRYGRKAWEVGELAPNGLRLARKFEYRNSDDKLILETSGTVSCQVDCDQQVLALTVLNRTATDYDGRRYPVRETAYKSTTNYTVTDRSFLDRGLADCTAVRMNVAAPVAEGAACTPDTRQNPDGLDRITKNNYDAAGQLTTVQKAFGTPEQVDYAAYTYTPNGKQEYVTDANGNKARFVYDGFDRLSQWQFPSKTTPGVVNAADFEQYGYDNNGNRTSLKKRDGSTLTFVYDALNRMYHKGGATADVLYTYDLADRQLSALFSTGGQGITNSYNGFGDLISATSDMGGTARTLTYGYDVAGRRTQIVHPENGSSYTFTYAYDALSRLAYLCRGAGACDGSSSTLLDSFAYGTNGLPSSRSEAAGSSVGYAWDDVGRLTAQTDAFAGGAGNAGWTLGYNPAAQIKQETRDNDAYASLAPASGTAAYVPNGLNQYSSVGGTAYTYDANGNLTGNGTWTYTYDKENRLTNAVGPGVSATLSYDPLGRLWKIAGTGVGDTIFLYDGDAMVAEYGVSSGTLTDRYVHGSNSAADDPLVWYEGATIANTARHWLHADHLGSIVASVDNSGSNPAINRYDEYGMPATGNVGRFQYTGQVWLPEIGLYYYKARMYSAALGRFLQTDPVGYEGGINLYAYVGGDPINGTDFNGNCPVGTGCEDTNGLQGMEGTRAEGTRIPQFSPPSQASQTQNGQSNSASSNAENLEPKRGDTRAKLDPLNPDQQAQWTGISHTPSVIQAAKAAFAQSMKDGLERGFFIYSNQRGGYYPGRTVTGLSDSLPGLAGSFVPVNPRVGNFDLARAYQHIHPGNFSGVGRADVADRNFGRSYGIFTIILSREGVTVGY